MGKSYTDIRTVAFMFVTPVVDDAEGYRETCMEFGTGLRFILIGVKDFEIAKREAKRMVDNGVVMLELCAGFGDLMVAEIIKTLESRIPVGVIRIDNHGGYNGESGDVRWLGVNDYSKTFSISPAPPKK